MNYEEVKSELDRAPWFGRVPTLARMDALLENLDMCHVGSKNIIVTGTNGKGSVSAFLHSIFSQRYVVGLFTSPHLEDWTERIRVGNEYISYDDFARLYERVSMAFSKVEQKTGELPTVFERLLAMSMVYFAEKDTNVNIVEVGIEGPYDSTNLLPAEAVLVASVGVDHTKLLGETEIDIAWSIASAFRPHRIAILGKSKVEALNILETAARHRKNRVYRYGREFWWDGRFFSHVGSLEFELRLRGHHQYWNASTAVQAALALQERGFRVDVDNIVKGVKEARWPGRLEVVRSKPLLVLDGAHNPSAAAVLSDALSQLYPGKKWVLAFAAMKDKDWEGTLKPLLGMAEEVLAVSMGYERAERPELIADFVARNGVAVRVVSEEDVLGLNADCVAFGSLYLVGDLRRMMSRAV